MGLFRTFFKGIAKVKVKKIMAVLVMSLGVLLSLYPFLSNFLYERSARAQVEYIREEAKHLKTETREKYLQQANAYNEGLAEAKICFKDAFDGESSADKSADKEEKYYETLAASSSRGLMGVLEIPSIGAELPVYYGTSEEILQKGIGHLKGSSIPTGRKGTHAVLTGHTGLNKARLFTDLVMLQKGDLFFITILNETLTYRVDQILVCLPEDTQALRIVPEEEYVTLVTCTPYGINDHRLLVRGTRTEYAKEMNTKEKKKKQGSLWLESYKRALKIGGSLLLLLLLFFFLQKKLRRQK